MRPFWNCSIISYVYSKGVGRQLTEEECIGSRKMTSFRKSKGGLFPDKAVEKLSVEKLTGVEK